LIEQKLRSFFDDIKAKTNGNHVEHTFSKIEKTCLHLQNSRDGKCKSHIHRKEIGYVSRENLCKKYELSKITDGLTTPHHICSEIMGIKQQITFDQTEDAGLGILNTFWLGLIPSAIQQTILENIKQDVLLKYTPDTATCKVYEAELQEQWNGIKDLIVAKATGLHRIIGQTILSNLLRKSYHRE